MQLIATNHSESKAGLHRFYTGFITIKYSVFATGVNLEFKYVSHVVGGHKYETRH